MTAAPAALASVPVPVCGSGTCTVTFPETGAAATWTAPVGVTSATVTLDGGQGGSAAGISFSPHAQGGDGATVVAAVPVSPGSSYTVQAGGAAPGGGSQVGGYDGGGTGDSGGSGNTFDLGGGGGGASSLALGSTLLLVAGGGGGGGGNGEGAGAVDRAGGGGGPSAAAGTGGTDATPDELGAVGGGGGGGAGTAAGLNGGTAGKSSAGSGAAGAAGASDAGGHGGDGGGGDNGGNGGGGGGGFFGGGGGGGGAGNLTSNGGGGGGGGGGGSDFVTGTATSSTVTDGAWSGNGQVIISYANPIAAGTPDYSTGAGQVLSVPVAGGLLSAAGVTAPAGDTLTASGPSGGTTAHNGTVTVNGDGSFSYTPATGFTGGDTFAYTVTDASGDSATGTATITVQALAAQAITFTTNPPSPAVTGTTYTPAATGGASGNPVTFTVDPASTPGTCSVSSGVVSFTAAGSCVIDANQAGGGGFAAAPQVSQTITVDTAPAFVLDSPPLTAQAGQVYSYTFAASGSPAPAYALAPGAPSWLSVDPGTGIVSGTPPAGTKSFSYSVTAANPAGSTTAGPFTVTVAKAVVTADVSAALSCTTRLTVKGTGSCTLTVTNHGPATASKVAGTIALPVLLSETSCTNSCVRHGNLYSWQTPSLNSGASLSVTITFLARQAGTALILAIGGSSNPDPRPLNNIALQLISISR